MAWNASDESGPPEEKTGPQRKPEVGKLEVLARARETSGHGLQAMSGVRESHETGRWVVLICCEREVISRIRATAAIPLMFDG